MNVHLVSTPIGCGAHIFMMSKLASTIRQCFLIILSAQWLLCDQDISRSYAIPILGLPSVTANAAMKIAELDFSLSIIYSMVRSDKVSKNNNQFATTLFA